MTCGNVNVKYSDLLNGLLIGWLLWKINQKTIPPIAKQEPHFNQSGFCILHSFNDIFWLENPPK